MGVVVRRYRKSLNRSLPQNRGLSYIDAGGIAEFSVIDAGLK